MQKTAIASLVVVILLLASIYFLGERQVKRQADSLEVHPTSYFCQAGRSLVAQFSEGQVEINLSDGRQFTLPNTISASGARFAYEGDEIVFWNKGQTSFLEEKGEQTYVGCLAEGTTTSADLKMTNEPTDFAVQGVVTYDTPGLEKNTAYLVYEKVGKPALSTALVFDALSWCGTPLGGTQCLALSVYQPFKNARVLVEGVLMGETLIVRKMQTVDDDQLGTIPKTGYVFVSWSEAVLSVKNCQVKTATQSHNLDIYLEMKNGDQLKTVEPKIDEIFAVTKEAETSCQAIPIATE